MQARDTTAWTKEEVKAMKRRQEIKKGWRVNEKKLVLAPTTQVEMKGFQHSLQVSGSSSGEDGSDDCWDRIIVPRLEIYASLNYQFQNTALVTNFSNGSRIKIANSLYFIHARCFHTRLQLVTKPGSQISTSLRSKIKQNKKTQSFGFVLLLFLAA